MNKTIAAVLSGLMLSASCALPVLAEDTDGMGVAKAIGTATWRMAAFGVGTVVGIPVAVVRKSSENTNDSTKKIAGDNKWLVAPALLVGLPVGLFTGGLEGVYLGTANSWNNRIDKPYGKEAFSLGDLED